MSQNQLSNPQLLDRLTENISTSYPLCKNLQEAINYLEFLNRTEYDNRNTMDLYDYEKLIYIDINFGKTNDQVRRLLNVIKTRISTNYIYKQKYLQRLTDDLIPNYISTELNNCGPELIGALHLNQGE